MTSTVLAETCAAEGRVPASPRHRWAGDRLHPAMTVVEIRLQDSHGSGREPS